MSKHTQNYKKSQEFDDVINDAPYCKKKVRQKATDLSQSKSPKYDFEETPEQHFTLKISVNQNYPLIMRNSSIAKLSAKVRFEPVDHFGIEKRKGKDPFALFTFKNSSV